MSSSFDDEARSALAGVRILVVEDEPDTRELVALTLRDRGAVVLEAGEGSEALGVIEAFRPDVLVSDLSLPVMDGWEFVRRVRAMGLRVPALALSANASSDDAARALAAGFDAHVAKPIGSDDLLHAVLSLADARRASPP